MCSSLFFQHIPFGWGGLWRRCWSALKCIDSYFDVIQLYCTRRILLCTKRIHKDNTRDKTRVHHRGDYLGTVNSKSERSAPIIWLDIRNCILNTIGLGQVTEVHFHSCCNILQSAPSLKGVNPKLLCKRMLPILCYCSKKMFSGPILECTCHMLNGSRRPSWEACSLSCQKEV